MEPSVREVDSPSPKSIVTLSASVVATIKVGHNGTFPVRGLAVNVIVGKATTGSVAVTVTFAEASPPEPYAVAVT